MESKNLGFQWTFKHRRFVNKTVSPFVFITFFQNENSARGKNFNDRIICSVQFLPQVCSKHILSSKNPYTWHYFSIFQLDIIVIGEKIPLSKKFTKHIELPLKRRILPSTFFTCDLFFGSSTKKESRSKQKLPSEGEFSEARDTFKSGERLDPKRKRDSKRRRRRQSRSDTI